MAGVRPTRKRVVARPASACRFPAANRGSTPVIRVRKLCSSRAADVSAESLGLEMMTMSPGLGPSARTGDSVAAGLNAQLVTTPGMKEEQAEARKFRLCIVCSLAEG